LRRFPASEVFHRRSHHLTARGHKILADAILTRLLPAQERPGEL